MIRKTTALSLIAAAFSALIIPSAHAAEQIHWAANLEEARSLAAHENKLLLIHFWTPDCGPCKVVEKKVFPTPAVAQTINMHFVALKVNAYQDTALRDHFGVRQWPTDIVATVDGKAVHRMTTTSNPNQYVQLLSDVAVKNRKMTPSRNQEAVQFAQRPGYQTQSAPRWADTIAAPNLTDNSARARRPGIDPSMRPGFQPPLGGPMIQSPQASASRSSPISTDNRFGNNIQAAPEAIANRFATNDSSQFAQQQQRPVNQAEINNPYANHVAAAPKLPAQQPLAQAQLPPQRQQLPIQSPVAAAQAPTNTWQPPAQTPAQTAASNQPADFASRTTESSTPSEFTSPQYTSPNVATVKSVPAEEPTYGLDGRCPVTLVTKSKWVKGNTEWGAVHRGHTYLFAGLEEQQKFLADPDEYSPVLAGMDVVQLADAGKVLQGDRRYGVLYDDDGSGPRPSRIYLFDSVATRNRFESRPESFIQPVMQAMQQNRLDSLLR